MTKLPAKRTANSVKAADKPVRKLRITPRVKRAIELMAYQGLKRDEAAQMAGLRDNSLYVALRRPDVRRAYLQAVEVIRTAGAARRIFRLEEIAEQNDNKMASVAAIRALEGMDTGESVGPMARSAGFQIAIVHQTPDGVRSNTLAIVGGGSQPKPIIEHDPGPPDDAA
jgi:hypothetical protein